MNAARITALIAQHARHSKGKVQNTVFSIELISDLFHGAIVLKVYFTPGYQILAS